MARPGKPRLGLGEIFQDAFRESGQWRFLHDTPEFATPTAEISGRAPSLHMLRQALPRRLGGYSDDLRKEFDRYYRESPENKFNIFSLGRYPVVDTDTSGRYLSQEQAGPAGRRMRMAAQVGGALTGDIMTQGIQNVYWFANAWEPLSMVGGRLAMHNALRKVDPLAPAGSPFGSGPKAVAATFPMILAASAAAGNLFRQPGYQAVLPDMDGDRRDTTDPVGERVLRLVGRTGKLLPYNEFVKDRPDVSRDEYEGYKAYLFGNKSLVKGTMDGIHGPEVSLLGRSMPLLTGAIPLIGGAIGGRIGLRMAGKRLSQGKQFEKLRRLTDSQRVAGEEARGAIGAAAMRLGQERHNAATNAREAQERLVHGRLLGGTLAGMSAGLGVTAAGAQLLEQMRRSANMRANQEAEGQIEPAA